MGFGHALRPEAPRSGGFSAVCARARQTAESAHVPVRHDLHRGGIFLQYTAVVIDDEPWVAEGIARMLPWGEYGIEVAEIFTGALEGCAYILKNQPDVVITDIRMPDLSGLELMARCRAEGLDTPFVVISGYSDFDYVQEAIAQGAFDYIEKPVDIDEIRPMLKRLSARLFAGEQRKVWETLEAIDQPGTVQQAFSRFHIAPAGTAWRVIEADIQAVPAVPPGVALLPLPVAEGRFLLILNGDRERVLAASEAISFVITYAGITTSKNVV